MSGPWQKYAATPPAPSGSPAPWAKYAEPQKLPIDQEMHPAFGVGDRLLLKNFANSPESMVAYLKQKHPDMDIQVHNGQVIGKAPGEKTYKALDPDPGILSDPIGTLKDLPLDVADVGTDVAQGTASTVASGAAGAAGAAATLPAGGVGALPAAITAGGTVNAGLEALKQKLGQYFGIPQQVSGKQVAFAGGAGALSPLLFGTGASAAQIASRAASPTQTATITAAQRGLGGRAVNVVKNRVLPGIGEYVSGVPAEVIKERAKHPEKLAALQDDGLTDYLTEVHENIRQGLAAKKVAVGQALEKEIGAAGKTVNLSQTKKIIDGHIKALEDSELKNNPLVKQQIAELRGLRDEMLTEVTETVTKEPVMAASSLLDEAGKPILRQTGTKEVVKKTASEIPDQVSAQKAFELQELLKDQAELTRLGQGTTSRFSQGATAGEKAWAEANRKAYNSINDELGAATDGMSSELKKQYREYAQLQRDLKNRFSDPQRTYQTLSGLNTKGKQVLKERLEGISRLTKGEVNPLEDAKVLSAYKHFVEQPSKSPVSAGGTTSTSRSLGLRAVGGMIGAKAAPVFGLSPQLGMGAGLWAGDYLGSPHALNYYINAGRAAQRGANAVSSRIPETVKSATPLSVWEMMYSQKPMENMYEQNATSAY